MSADDRRRSVLEKLAASLTAETTELLPYLPYLLQDLWELGTSPQTVVELIGRHIVHPEKRRFFDLACGKGAVSVALAKAFQARVFGIDIIPDFIDVARLKADEFGVASLCAFSVADANAAVRNEKGYGGVIFGAAGNILGSPEESLELLCGTVRDRGFIIIDDGYINDENAAVRYHNYEYPTRGQWLELFDRCGLRLMEEMVAPTEESAATNSADLEKIRARATELVLLHPEKAELFEGYVASQADEGHDLENTVAGVIWMLQKI